MEKKQPEWEGKEFAFFCKTEECIEDRLCAALGSGD